MPMRTTEMVLIALFLQILKISPCQRIIYIIFEYTWLNFFNEINSKILPDFTDSLFTPLLSGDKRNIAPPPAPEWQPWAF